MSDLKDSIAIYERGLATTFGKAFRKDDLIEKHEKMNESAFLFLRATCWRWTESASTLCPQLTDAPIVDCVGDAHAGNFGLWRDAQFRLVWGVNDFDEAAQLPYTLDLVRLCASLLLADTTLTAEAITKVALDGYKSGLVAPQPAVLENDHLWLRNIFEASDKDREKFWNKLRNADPEPIKPRSLLKPLKAALPEDAKVIRIAPRSAGAGSLGRPRFVAYTDYRGSPFAVEIKAQMPSCWQSGRMPGLSAKITSGRYRSPDPTLVYTQTHVVRRLSPNNRKLDFNEIEDAPRAKLIKAMAADIAAIHADNIRVETILRDLDLRPNSWLTDATSAVADWTSREWEIYLAMK